jgi:hypothetical protein
MDYIIAPAVSSTICKFVPELRTQMEEDPLCSDLSSQFKLLKLCFYNKVANLNIGNLVDGQTYLDDHITLVENSELKNKNFLEDLIENINCGEVLLKQNWFLDSRSLQIMVTILVINGLSSYIHVDFESNNHDYYNDFHDYFYNHIVLIIETHMNMFM